MKRKENGGNAVNNKYPNLLSPARIGNVELRNRTVMAAMGMSQSDDGFVSEAVLNHYAERSKGGVGAVIVEVTCVDSPLGLNTKGMLVIDDDKYIPGMTKLAGVIHEGGAKAFLQISHTGRGARRSIIGAQPVGPSAVAMPYSFMMGLANETPRELTIEEIKAIEDKYAEAALRAKKAGFDGIEIHSVGYYLGQQFLSKKANIRSDEYGGSRENRIRFHLNIIKKIRKLCGEDFAIIVKLSVVEQGPDGGISMLDGMYYTKKLQQAGVDSIEVLAGKWSTEPGKKEKPESAYPDCMAVILCLLMKIGVFLQTGRKIKIPLIGGGRAQNPEKAEKAIASGKCEMIFIGHGLLVQPDLVNLVSEGREDEIRPCIGCGHCINEQLQHGGRAICSGNAVLGRGDNTYGFEPAQKKKKIAVIGAGVAGIEAARIAAYRGHEVDLFEESDAIGGQMNLADKPPFKNHFSLLVPYLKRQIELSGVKLHLNKKITKQDILNMKPDAVICATGLKPASPPIPGAELTVNAKEILAGRQAGKNAVIIGGGSVGCETAEFLAERGKKVTVIEMLNTLAGNTGKTAQSILLGHLKGAKVSLLTECKVKEINANGVSYTDKDGREHFVKADTAILAIGDKPDTSLYDSLKNELPEIYNIGDSAGGGIIPCAVYDGYTLGCRI